MKTKRAASQPKAPILPKEQPKPAAPPPNFIPRFGMGLEDWKRTPELIKYAKSLFATTEFQMLLDVVRNSPPAETNLPDGGCTRYLGRLEGHDHTIKILLSLPLWPAQAPEDVETTYGVSQED